MSSCDFDHPLEDVVEKLADQKKFLPEALHNRSSQLLTKQPDQETLNELFHLLKKYDLITDKDKDKRNKGLEQLLAN